MLSLSGAECLRTLVSNAGAHFSDDSWGIVCGTISSLFEATQPNELLKFREQAHDNATAKQGEFDRSIIKCRAQLELIHTVEWITLAHHAPPPVTPAKTDGAPSVFVSLSEIC